MKIKRKAIKEFRSGLYPCFLVKDNKILKIDCNFEFNTKTHNIHHYIPFEIINKLGGFLNDIGAIQKFFVMPILMHNDLHSDLVSDEIFYKKYKINVKELLYSPLNSKIVYYDPFDRIDTIMKMSSEKLINYYNRK